MCTGTSCPQHSIRHVCYSPLLRCSILRQLYSNMIDRTYRNQVPASSGPGICPTEANSETRRVERDKEEENSSKD